MTIESVAYYAACGLVGAYTTGVISLGLYSHVCTEQINTQADLEACVAEEAKKLKLDLMVKSELTRIDEAVLIKNHDGYLIEVGQSFATRGWVRHELYHLKKGHIEKAPKTPVLCKIDYYIRREPMALIYGALGINV